MSPIITSPPKHNVYEMEISEQCGLESWNDTDGKDNVISGLALPLKYGVKLQIMEGVFFLSVCVNGDTAVKL